MVDLSMVMRPEDDEAERDRKRAFWATKTMEERVIAGWEIADELDRQERMLNGSPAQVGVAFVRVPHHSRDRW